MGDNGNACIVVKAEYRLIHATVSKSRTVFDIYSLSKPITYPEIHFVAGKTLMDVLVKCLALFDKTGVDPVWSSDVTVSGYVI